jgi:hypothetical protein
VESAGVVDELGMTSQVGTTPDEAPHNKYRAASLTDSLSMWEPAAQSTDLVATIQLPTRQSAPPILEPIEKNHLALLSWGWAARVIPPIPTAHLQSALRR